MLLCVTKVYSMCYFVIYKCLQWVNCNTFKLKFQINRIFYVSLYYKLKILHSHDDIRYTD